MQLFYAPDIESTNTLPEGESQHCVKVLRLNQGDQINITDGKGNLLRLRYAILIKNIARYQF